ncbi:TPA: 4Fe-4S binding protein, partial [Clostridioides difficile]|nr:4Fe-4S binding protein [Clostridioides difficile]
IIKNYKIPNVSKDLRLFSVKLPKFLNEPISKLITPKPVVRFQDCIKCGKCKEACPASTIEIGTKGAIIDLSKCIRCYCCHELCPKKAIDVKRNFVFKYVK